MIGYLRHPSTKFTSANGRQTKDIYVNFKNRNNILKMYKVVKYSVKRKVKYKYISYCNLKI